MDLRYPIGPFKLEEEVTEQARQRFIDQIAETPANLRTAVRGLSPEQLDTPYRPEGWTVRQVVHHVADSHINSYVRCKLALTEDQPTVVDYYEDRWGELSDANMSPVEVSLDLLESLHKRWVFLFKSLKPSDFSRAFVHPARGVVSLDTNLAIYAWHGRHHEAHITSLRERMKW
jgi:hypothetical protein